MAIFTDFSRQNDKGIVEIREPDIIRTYGFSFTDSGGKWADFATADFRNPQKQLVFFLMRGGLERGCRYIYLKGRRFLHGSLTVYGDLV